jgi:hypothetical protein
LLALSTGRLYLLRNMLFFFVIRVARIILTVCNRIIAFVIVVIILTIYNRIITVVIVVIILTVYNRIITVIVVPDNNECYIMYPRFN